MHNPSGVSIFYGGPGQGKTILVANCLTEYGRFGATLSLDVTGDIARAVSAEISAARLSQRVVIVKTQKEVDELSERGFFSAKKGIRQGTHVVVQAATISLDAAVDLWKSNAIDRPVGGSLRRRAFIAAACDETESVFASWGESNASAVDAVVTARNEKRAMIFAAKRPTRIPAFLRSVAMNVCVFKLASDADARAIEDLAPSQLFKSRDTSPQFLARGKYLYFGAHVHSPDSELEVYDGRDDLPPFLVDARAYFVGKRKR